MYRPKVVITAFGPFSDVIENPTDVLLRAFLEKYELYADGNQDRDDDQDVVEKTAPAGRKRSGILDCCDPVAKKKMKNLLQNVELQCHTLEVSCEAAVNFVADNIAPKNTSIDAQALLKKCREMACSTREEDAQNKKSSVEGLSSRFHQGVNYCIGNIQHPCSTTPPTSVSSSKVPANTVTPAETDVSENADPENDTLYTHKTGGANGPHGGGTDGSCNDTGDPDLVIHFGAYVGSEVWNLECRGLNWQDLGSFPDVRGYRRTGQIIHSTPQKNGTSMKTPDQIYTKVDVLSLLAEMTDCGMARTQISANAGTYLCNFLFYTSLYYNRSRNSIFIHIPSFQTMHIHEQLAYFEKMMEILLERLF